MSRHHRGAVLTGLALAAALALSGCDGQSADAPGSGATDSTTTTNPTSSTPETTGESTVPDDTTDTSPTPTTASPTTHDDSSAARARQSKVPMRRMPGFNEQWSWDGATSGTGEPSDGPARSRCQRASLTAIGAVVEYTTTYTRSDAADDAAAVTTGVFPDEQTATMAESVLAKWLATCRSNVRKQPGVNRVQVSTESTVDTVVGPGHQRLVSFGPVAGDRESRYFNGEGYVRDGDVLSYVVFHSVGQDYNYPAGQQPADLGLRMAATYLKRSR